MITYTEKDTNLSSIMKEAKLANMVTTVKYHVYGLRQLNNAPVLIDYEAAYTNEKFMKGIKALIDFLKLNDIESECFNSSDRHTVNIGLRLDLRTHLNSKKKPVLAASILSTVIYCLEDRIDTELISKYKLSNIPKFKPKKDGIVIQPGRMCEYGWWDDKIEKGINKIISANPTLDRASAIVRLFDPNSNDFLDA